VTALPDGPDHVPGQLTLDDAAPTVPDPFGPVLVLRGDAAALPLPDATVDVVITSPPYFGLRSYTDGGVHYEGQVGDEATPADYLDALITCTREWTRVLKPGGSIFVVLGDKYSTGNSGQSGMAKLSEQYRGGGHTQARAKTASGRVEGMPLKSLLGLPWRYAIRCVDDLGLILRAEIIWAKPNGLPESVTDRVRRSHEQVFHLVKQPRYYTSVDEIREQYGDRHGGGRSLAAGITGIASGGKPQTGLSAAALNPLGKLPGSVWEIPTAQLTVPDHLDVDHFAAYPPELVRRIVLGWSPPGGTIVDPFGGTGTTALVASVLGRVGITVDLSVDYGRLARWRTQDPGERARALGVPKPPPQVDGQLGLFGTL
jgi:DNA modification methylase